MLLVVRTTHVHFQVYIVNEYNIHERRLLFTSTCNNFAHISTHVNTPGDGLGRAILGGSALFGVGSLCFYGLGLSGETGAIDRAGYVVKQYMLLCMIVGACVKKPIHTCTCTCTFSPGSGQTTFDRG